MAGVHRRHHESSQDTHGPVCSFEGQSCKRAEGSARTYPNPSGRLFSISFSRMGLQLMPQKKNCRDHQPDSQTDQEKPAVRGKRNQKNHHHGDGNDQARRAAEGCLGWAG